LKNLDIKMAYAKGLVAFAFIALVFTEVSSYFNCLNRKSALVLWTIVMMVTLFIFFKNVNRNIFKKANSADQLKQGSTIELFILAFIILSTIYLFFLTGFVPPNNLDSHHYHLNRIVNWIQNENVKHFPSTFAPELYHNAMAEYLVLQTFLLTNSDRFSALVQFMAMIGSLFTTSLITKEIGLSKKTQIIAVFVTFTMTIGLLESTTTQVDYVACFFFTFFVLQYLKWQRSNSNRDMFWMSLTFGLGAFTKYTIFLYAFPFYVFLVLKLLFQKKWKSIFKITLATILSIVLVYSLFWYQNYELFGNILSPTQGSRLYTERIPNEAFGFGSFLSILARNIFIHAGLPIEAFNIQIDKIVLGIHSLLNVDIHDTRFSFNLYSTRFSIQEDMAPNTFHFYIGLISVAYMLFKKKGNKDLNLITLLAFLGLVLCSFILKFELWVSRTQMPFFVIFSIYIAYFLTLINQNLAKAIIVLQASFAILVITSNPNKLLFNLKYQVKKLQNYIPSELIPDRTKEGEFDANVVSKWYSKSEGVYRLNNDGVTNKKIIFEALEKSHYYDVEKDYTILNKSRGELYYAPNYYEYREVENLFKDDLNEIKNIGILFYVGQGFYRYWAYLNYEEGVEAKMQHILFSKELLKLPNTTKLFQYNYVLTDHLEYMRNFIPEDRIERVKKSGKFYLVKLKKDENRQFTY
jgi:4-amino-4-deoxy-L-arabinose transferase-like glycosyltransferase